MDLAFAELDDPAAEIRLNNLDPLVGRIGLRFANTGEFQAGARQYPA
ncbi:hypothetical protein KRR38_25995 [Novosphingobium sp. G106]|nr:hypothetical protein [Novosphingobium sp. G106]MBV1691037.1 hypothetical protein [Novosphingobium sp. G106]